MTQRLIMIQCLDLRMNVQFENRAFHVLNDAYVTADEGTGIVHQTPVFGEDDHRIAIAHDGFLQPEDMPPCRFTSKVSDFQGQHVKLID